MGRMTQAVSEAVSSVETHKFVQVTNSEDFAMLGSDKAIVGAIAILILGIVISVVIG